MVRRSLRMLVEFRRYAAVAPDRIDVRASVQGGEIDRVIVHADGTLAVEGVAADLGAFQRELTLRIGDRMTRPNRVREPSTRSPAASGPFLGAVVEWVLGPSDSRAHAELLASGSPVTRFRLPPIAQPLYGHLRTETRVLGREQIYGSGMPGDRASPEVIALARRLPAPILDFGCGSGALVRALRNEGIDASGLELDTARIHDHLIDDVKSFITLYDGELPAPFKDGAFASVVCSEVLEHMPNAFSAIQELVRLAATSILITVPDISAIPRASGHRVVPWHLLEGTHVNFFTQRSLEAILAPYAIDLEMSRIGMVECDRLKYYTSLAAMARIH